MGSRLSCTLFRRGQLRRVTITRRNRRYQPCSFKGKKQAGAETCLSYIGGLSRIAVWLLGGKRKEGKLLSASPVYNWGKEGGGINVASKLYASGSYRTTGRLLTPRIVASRLPSLMRSREKKNPKKQEPQHSGSSSSGKIASFFRGRRKAQREKTKN